MCRRHVVRGVGAIGLMAFAAFAVPASPKMPGSAFAASQQDPYGGLTPLSTQELSELRGGFMVGDFEFEIGIELVSIAGNFTVTTTANLLPGGRVENAQTAVSQANGHSQANGQGQAQGDGSPAPLYYGPSAEVPSIATTESSDGGIRIDVESNNFVIVHDINGQNVLALATNTADGVNLDSTVNLNIAIENFSQLLNNVARNMPLMLRISRDSGIASVQ